MQDTTLLKVTTAPQTSTMSYFCSTASKATLHKRHSVQL